MRRLLRPILRAAAITGFFAACASADRGASAGSAVVRDSAGVEIVTSHSAQWPDGGGWRVDTTPITRIGDNESDSMQHWQYVEYPVRLSDGTVLVALQGEIRWFSADGIYLKSSTRVGEGPGEFRAFGSIYRMPGDSLIATDDFGKKTAVFAPDGSLVRESLRDDARIRALGEWIPFCGGTVLPDGSRIACREDASIPGPHMPRRTDSHVDVAPGPYRPKYRLHVISPALDRSWPLSVSGDPEGYGVTYEGQVEVFPWLLYSPRAVTASGGNPVRFAHAINPEYRIEVWSTDGRLTRVIERVGGRRAITAQEIADVVDGERNRSRGAPRFGFVEAALDQIPTPDSMPAVLDMAMSDRGELMVMREGLLESHSSMLYDVFDADGRWLGELRIPFRVQVVSFGDDYVLAVRPNEDGLFLVEVLPLRRDP